LLRKKNQHQLQPWEYPRIQKCINAYFAERAAVLPEDEVSSQVMYFSTHATIWLSISVVQALLPVFRMIRMPDAILVKPLTSLNWSQGYEGALTDRSWTYSIPIYAPAKNRVEINFIWDDAPFLPI
jgi:hypothetical protein